MWCLGNVCITMTELRDAQAEVKALFLGVSGRVFLGRMSNDRAKKICPHQCRWATPSLWRVWIEQERQRKPNLLILSVFCSQTWSSSLHTQTGTYTTSSPGSQFFRLRLNHTTHFSGSLACRWQIMGFLAFVIPKANSYKRSPPAAALVSISVYLSVRPSMYLSTIPSPVGSISLKIPNTGR